MSDRTTPLRRCLVAALLLAGLFVGELAAAADCGPPLAAGGKSRVQPFRVFDALLYRDKPDLSEFGISRVAVIDRGIWPDPKKPAGQPDGPLVKKVAATFPPGEAPVVLDFEHFPLTGDDASAAASAANLNAILAAFKAQAPGRRYGFYGMPPLRDYWRALAGTGSEKYRSWQAQNDRLAPLERNVDVLFPSLYTFYNDSNAWVRYATAQICEARRISNKPVYVFLWPEFHDSNAALRSTFIGADFWRLQLETARQLADGVVIWGGWDMASHTVRNWNEREAWWPVTREFAKRVQADPRAR